jgi:hypothetical protein
LAVAGYFKSRIGSANFCVGFAIQNQRAATSMAMPDWSRDQFGQFTEKL